MSEFKGTPGPWYVGDNGMDGLKPRYWIVADEETWCDRICSIPEYNEENAIANSNLISAAPDLLEALKNLVEDLEMRSKNGVVDCSHGIYCDARQAIAKALGETK